MVEAMIAAGIAMGFSAKEAPSLIYKMLQGSLSLLKNSKAPSRTEVANCLSSRDNHCRIKKIRRISIERRIIETFLAAYECAIHIE